MPAPIDRTGQRFGRLTVRRLSSERLHGQRVWECDCECGGKTLAKTCALVTEHKTSCGCKLTDGTCGRPFTKKEVRAEHKARRRLRHAGEWWIARRIAAKRLHRSPQTVLTWANLHPNPKLRNGCPWLDGRELRHTNLETAYGREVIYYAEKDVKEIVEAMAKRPEVPEFAELVHVGTLGDECGVPYDAVRRAYQGQPREKRPGKLKDGRSMPLAYVTKEFAALFRQTHLPDAKPGEMTIGQKAAQLRISPRGVDRLVERGKLKKRRGRIVRENGRITRGVYVYPAEVKANGNGTTGQLVQIELPFAGNDGASLNAGVPIAEAATKSKAGRPDQNQELLDFSDKARLEQPRPSYKEILKRFRVQHSNHPIFDADDADHAFRVARYKAKIKMSPN
jgi:hypothetical protein